MHVPFGSVIPLLVFKPREMIQPRRTWYTKILCAASLTRARNQKQCNVRRWRKWLSVCAFLPALLQRGWKAGYINTQDKGASAREGITAREKRMCLKNEARAGLLFLNALRRPTFTPPPSTVTAAATCVDLLSTRQPTSTFTEPSQQAHQGLILPPVHR